jgi:diaminobutyrate-2-oxoglutarate transaminase
LENYWQNDDLSNAVSYKEDILRKKLNEIAKKYKADYDIEVRGRGLAYGFEVKNDVSIAKEISEYSFNEKLICETCGSNGQVVKFLPPLTISEDILNEGLNRFETAVDKLFQDKKEKLKEEF